MVLRVVLVGHGHMGQALLEAWIASGVLAANDVAVVDPGEKQRRSAEAQGVLAVSEIREITAVGSPELIVLAVKPQLLSVAAQQYTQFVNGGTCFVSIAAGISINALERIFGNLAPLVRAMPNTPAAIGEGMTAIYFKPNVSPETRKLILLLMQAAGAISEIADEVSMDAVTALSGSGPAYLFHFVECLIESGMALGLPEETARILSIQTVFGAAKMVAKGERAPALLREQVTSPNGTTAAALLELMGHHQLRDLIATAVKAAHERSLQLNIQGDGLVAN